MTMTMWHYHHNQVKQSDQNDSVDKQDANDNTQNTDNNNDDSTDTDRDPADADHCQPVLTCVVEALKVMPSTEQMPRPAATDSDTNTTPAMPTPLWELTASLHLIREMQA